MANPQEAQRLQDEIAFLTNLINGHGKSTVSNQYKPSTCPVGPWQNLHSKKNRIGRKTAIWTNGGMSSRLQSNNNKSRPNRIDPAKLKWSKNSKTAIVNTTPMQYSKKRSMCDESTKQIAVPSQNHNQSIQAAKASISKSTVNKGVISKGSINAVSVQTPKTDPSSTRSLIQKVKPRLTGAQVQQKLSQPVPNNKKDLLVARAQKLVPSTLDQSEQRKLKDMPVVATSRPTQQKADRSQSNKPGTSTCQMQKLKSTATVSSAKTVSCLSPSRLDVPRTSSGDLLKQKMLPTSVNPTKRSLAPSAAEITEESLSTVDLCTLIQKQFEMDTVTSEHNEMTKQDTKVSHRLVQQQKTIPALRHTKTAGSSSVSKVHVPRTSTCKLQKQQKMPTSKPTKPSTVESIKKSSIADLCSLIQMQLQADKQKILKSVPSPQSKKNAPQGKQLQKRVKNESIPSIQTTELLPKSEDQKKFTVKTGSSKSKSPGTSTSQIQRQKMMPTLELSKTGGSSVSLSKPYVQGTSTCELQKRNKVPSSNPTKPPSDVSSQEFPDKSSSIVHLCSFIQKQFENEPCVSKQQNKINREGTELSSSFEVQQGTVQKVCVPSRTENGHHCAGEQGKVEQNILQKGHSLQVQENVDKIRQSEENIIKEVKPPTNILQVKNFVNARLKEEPAHVIMTKAQKDSSLPKRSGQETSCDQIQKCPNPSKTVRPLLLPKPNLQGMSKGEIQEEKMASTNSPTKLQTSSTTAALKKESSSIVELCTLIQKQFEPNISNKQGTELSVELAQRNSSSSLPKTSIQGQMASEVKPQGISTDEMHRHKTVCTSSPQKPEPFPKTEVLTPVTAALKKESSSIVDLCSLIQKQFETKIYKPSSSSLPKTSIQGQTATEVKPQRISTDKIHRHKTVCTSSPQKPELFPKTEVLTPVTAALKKESSSIVDLCSLIQKQFETKIHKPSSSSLPKTSIQEQTATEVKPQRISTDKIHRHKTVCTSSPQKPELFPKTEVLTPVTAALKKESSSIVDLCSLIQKQFETKMCGTGQQSIPINQGTVVERSSVEGVVPAVMRPHASVKMPLNVIEEAAVSSDRSHVQKSSKNKTQSQRSKYKWVATSKNVQSHEKQTVEGTVSKKGLQRVSGVGLGMSQEQTADYRDMHALACSVEEYPNSHQVLIPPGSPVRARQVYNKSKSVFRVGNMPAEKSHTVNTIVEPVIVQGGGPKHSEHFRKNRHVVAHRTNKYKFVRHIYGRKSRTVAPSYRKAVASNYNHQLDSKNTSVPVIRTKYALIKSHKANTARKMPASQETNTSSLPTHTVHKEEAITSRTNVSALKLMSRYKLVKKAVLSTHRKSRKILNPQLQGFVIRKATASAKATKKLNTTVSPHKVHYATKSFSAPSSPRAHWSAQRFHAGEKYESEPQSCPQSPAESPSKKWQSKYSLRRENTGGATESLTINQLLGRKVNNVSRNKFKYIKGSAASDKKHQYGMMSPSATSKIAVPPSRRTLVAGKRKLDRRHWQSKEGPLQGVSPILRYARSQYGQRKHQKLAVDHRKQKFFRLGGVVYKGSRTKLTKTRPPLSTKSGHRVVKGGRTSARQTVSVLMLQGVRFQVASSGRSLKRINAPTGVQRTAVQGKSRKDVVIRGTAFKTTPHSLRRVTDSSARRIASRALHRSIWTVAAARNKKSLPPTQQYCMFYNRFGKCNRGNACPYIHDPERVAVCTRFLRGTCKVTNCPFSHKVTKGKMPVCWYFLKGICSREDCPYQHVNVARDAEVCQHFINGYCPLGEKCKKKHTLECASFAATGVCPQGKQCKLIHRKKAAKRKASSNAEPAKPRKHARRDSDEAKPGTSGWKPTKTAQETPLTEPANDIALPLKDRTLPSFISLAADTDCSILDNSGSDVAANSEPLHIHPRLSL